MVTVKLLQAIGVNYGTDYAHQLGIISSLTLTLSLALGASGVTSTNSSRPIPRCRTGRARGTLCHRKGDDRNGNLVEEHEDKKEPVISLQTGYLITDLLQGVVQEGTGTKARELGRPAAGKTGTTNELKDAWFIGYTPSYLTGVWVGYDDHNVSLGKGETGGHAACPIWVYFMKESLKDKPVETFTIPEGIVFARLGSHSGAGGPEETGGGGGGGYAAFAGNVPMSGKSPSEEVTSDYSAPDAVTDAEQGPENAAGRTGRRSSSGESFFKSDLF